MADWRWCRDGGLLNRDVGACRNFLKVNLAVCVVDVFERVGTKLLLDGSSRTGLALSYINAQGENNNIM